MTQETFDKLLQLVNSNDAVKYKDIPDEVMSDFKQFIVGQTLFTDGEGNTRVFHRDIRRFTHMLGVKHGYIK